MRGYTTLLSHILGSHKQICGYRECALSYLDKKSIRWLYWEVMREKNDTETCDFILDKVLHDKFTVSDEVILDPDVLIMFALREPRGVIKSLLKLGKLTQTEWTEQKAVDYYIGRLGSLVEIAQQCRDLNKAFYFIDTDNLVAAPDNMLKKISSFLKLDSTLQEEYEIFQRTGEAGAGDPSKSIKQGKIIRKEKPVFDENEADDLLIKAQIAYEKAREALTKMSVAL